MGYTLFEKIIRNHSSAKKLCVGSIVEVDVDRMMIHDFFTPFCIEKFHMMGFSRVKFPDRIVFIYDHLVPASFIGDYRHHKVAEEFASLQGIKNIHRHDGVCHQLMHEMGYIKSGDIVLGTDSHTTTYGALGVLATGIGYTEMAAVLGTGKLWLKIAPTIRIKIDGTLSEGTYSKDIILQILADISIDGANYKIIEFQGETIDKMSIASRLVLSNMSVEAGAKAGLIAPDAKTIQYLQKHGIKDDIDLIKSDDDAEYEAELNYRAEDFLPMVACPSSVDNCVHVCELSNIEIDQAFLGSCTNGRLEDLEIASKILRGKQVHPNVRFIVVPASIGVYREAIKKGIIELLVNAGVIINHPSCGLCAGRSGGILVDGENIISSNNRNFLGRMGGNEVNIYLGSPATVAASGLEGRIVDPRRYL